MRIAFKISLCAIVLLLGVAGAARAQTDLSVSNDIQIEFTPRYPGPHQTVEARAISFSFDTSKAPFTWYINGKKVGSGLGKTAVSFETGAVGQKTTVRVTAEPAGGRTFDKTVTVYASDLDLLWSADTYTPPGYRGKALPVNGSTVRVVALPNIVIDGKRIAASALTYTWEMDNRPLRESSGVGRDTFSVGLNSSPGVEHTVKVRVEDALARAQQEQFLRISAQKPRLTFYELDPLRGPRYQNSIMGTYNLRSGGETRFLAVPYFFSNRNFALLRYIWRVGTETLAAGATPEILSFRTQQGSTALTNISLEIESPNIFERARGSFMIDVK